MVFFIPDVFLLWFQNGEIRGPRVSVGGAPVLGTDGTPVMRDALKLADEATITARMPELAPTVQAFAFITTAARVLSMNTD
ncbi:hypothetical protein B7K56_23470 [Escherichia coli]|nr:hypothetical protein [Escherichia coli]PQI93933.1 hypothetical protein C5U38_23970 [Escherichia fergusonii]